MAQRRRRTHTVWSRSVRCCGFQVSHRAHGLSEPTRLTPNEKRLTELLAKLVDTGSETRYPAELGVIFHSTGLHTSGKFFAFVRKGELVIKLPAPRVAELIAHQAGRPFDAGRQRPM